MKYLNLDQDTLIIIDRYFKSRFSFVQTNNIQIEIDNIFPWTYEFNSEDIQIMFEDLQKEMTLKYYVPKYILSSPIKFINYIFKKIPNLENYYLKPYHTHGFFRTYYLVHR